MSVVSRIKPLIRLVSELTMKLNPFSFCLGTPFVDPCLHLKPTGLLYGVILEFHASLSASREELLNGCVVSSGAYRIKLIGASYHAEGKRISIGHTLPTLTGLKEEIRRVIRKSSRHRGFFLSWREWLLGFKKLEQKLKFTRGAAAAAAAASTQCLCTPTEGTV